MEGSLVTGAGRGHWNVSHRHPSPTDGPHRLGQKVSFFQPETDPSFSGDVRKGNLRLMQVTWQHPTSLCQHPLAQTPVYSPLEEVGECSSWGPHTFPNSAKALFQPHET